MKGVLKVFQQFIEANDDSGNIARFSWLIGSITEELAEELDGKDEETMALYMAQIGEVISWIGHGDNERLPPQLQMFADAIQPTPAPAEDEHDSYIAVDAG